MDLEKINEEYSKLKEDIKKESLEIESLEGEINVLELDQQQEEINIKRAKLNGDKVAEKDAQDALKIVQEKIKQVRQESESKRASLTILKTKIQSKIDKVKENPEMKKHLEEVLAKKYQRKITKLEKDKEEVEGKKDRLTDLNKLVTEHPALENNLKGIMTATKQIKDLEKELKSLEYDAGGGAIQYTDPVKASEIKNTLLPNANKKLEDNKTPLMAYITKNKLNITEQDINEFADTNFIVDKKGNIDLKTTMTREISGLNRQIKGLDKSIKHHTVALGKQAPDNSIPRRTTTSPVTPTTPTTPTQPENPKWYQFIKRFKNWNEKRKQQALPGGQPQPQPDGSTQEQNEFKNSLKYEVVRDLVEKEQTDKLKEAKKSVKEAETKGR